MFYLVFFLSKLIYFLIRLLHLGAGYTWPGHIALKIYPALFKSKHISFPKGLIYVSGTNGKTTTTKLLTHVFKKSGFKVLHNKSGANLLNGIASALLLEGRIFVKSQDDLAVFEVDELTLPLLVEKIPPRILVLLNLSRDQLDRYGEIDIILEKWNKAFENLDRTTTLLLDSTQKKFNTLAENYKGKIFYFDESLENLRHTKLVGDFNAKNVNAAIIAAELLGINKEESLQNLSDFDAAYGRGELIEYKNNLYHLFLAKNPTSFNNNLNLLLSEEILSDAILFVLNDDPRDGRDVSWIYDISREKLKEACANKEIFVTGSRCLDFAVRLGYAEVAVKKENISLSVIKIMDKVRHTPHIKVVAAFPNYSAMLELREVLVGRSIL